MATTFDDTRIREILLGRRAVRVYPMPGLPVDAGVNIGLRALTERDIDLARVEAQRYTQKLGANIDIDPDFLDRDIVRQILSRACVAPDSPPDSEPHLFFATVDDVRALDSVTVEALFRLYREHQDTVSPLRQIPKEEMAAFVEALKKAPSGAEPFSAFGHETLVRLCGSLVSLLRSS